MDVLAVGVSSKRFSKLAVFPNYFIVKHLHGLERVKGIESSSRLHFICIFLMDIVRASPARLQSQRRVRRLKLNHLPWNRRCSSGHTGCGITWSGLPVADRPVLQK